MAKDVETPCCKKAEKSCRLLKTLIVDDESLARAGLRYHLEQDVRIDIQGECSNGREAIECLRHSAVDLVFLDIQMPSLNGFDVVKALQPETLPLIIFATAFNHYAVQAFDVNAVDYLLKPFDPERLSEAVTRAYQRFSHPHSRPEKSQLLSALDISALNTEGHTISGNDPSNKDGVLTIKTGRNTEYVSIHEIDWVDAAGDYMCLHVQEKTHILRVTMKALMEQLPVASFQRIHRSTLVNMKRAKRMSVGSHGDSVLELSTGAVLKVSRSYQRSVQAFFSRH